MGNVMIIYNLLYRWWYFIKVGLIWNNWIVDFLINLLDELLYVFLIGLLRMVFGG